MRSLQKHPSFPSPLLSAVLRGGVLHVVSVRVWGTFTCARESVVVVCKLKSHRTWVQFLTLPPMAM